ncbi:MAG TPA: ABC transporter substrate-binding protein [Candidatus Binatia bacterium]|nr:ABC transporter substrate-binding protein [Candidatus Binatia bacterium]
MNTSGFVFVCLLLAVFLPAGSEAQQAKVYRVGLLSGPGKTEERPQTKGFRAGLREAGYIEDKNLQLNVPEVKTYTDLRVVAKTYVETGSDAIVTQGGTVTRIARDATKEIPIVFISGVSDPVGEGFVKSLARPGTNLTGLTNEAGGEIYGKKLELFKESVPSLRRAVLLYNARGENPGHAKSLTVVREVASKLGLALSEKPVKSVGDIDDVLRPAFKQVSEGIFIICSGLFVQRYKEISAFAIQKKLPLWGCNPDLSPEALLSYEPDRYRTAFRGAWYVDKILKGAKPAELPVE